MVSDKLSQNFYVACASGDFNTIKKLFEDYDRVQSSIFSSFINLFKPIINPHYHEDSALLYACSYENHHIVEYLLNQKNFVDGLNADSQIEVCLSFIMKSGNLELTKRMLSLIENKPSLTSTISLAFNSACAKGHLDIIKYILEDSEFNWLEYDKKKREKDAYSLVYTGFIDACKRGQLDIVKYIIESKNIKEKIDLSNFNSSFIVNNVDIIHYFIFDLNIKKDDPFISKLKVNDDITYQMEKFFKIKDIYTDVTQDINNTELPPVKKRMKI